MQTPTDRPYVPDVIERWLTVEGPTRAPALQRQTDDSEDELIDLYLDAQLQAESR